MQAFANGCTARPASRPSAGGREAEGLADHRHYYMGLLRELPDPEIQSVAGEGDQRRFRIHNRLDEAPRRHLFARGHQLADYFRPHALDWFDRRMEALADFAVTVTLYFTPEHRGVAPHRTSPPISNEGFAAFCAAMVRRYADDGAVPKPSLLSHAGLV